MKQKIGKYTSQKGITLIALVITIIVLLILAGVAINMVLGDNGIIGQAQNAKLMNEESKADEISKVKDLNIEVYESTGTYPKETELEYFKIEDGVLKEFKSSGAPSDIVIPQIVNSISNEENKEDGEPKGAFKECETLTSITIPKTVKTIGDLEFAGCTNLKNVYLLEGIKEICASAFSRCTNLESIVLPSTLQTFGDNIFYGCESLENVVFRDKIESIGSAMFYDCVALKFVKLSNTLKYIDTQSFYGCTSLESITVPVSVEWLGVESFKNCVKLKTIEFNSEISPDFTHADGVFNNCPLEKVYIPQGKTAEYTEKLGDIKCGKNNDVLVSSLLTEK